MNTSAHLPDLDSEGIRKQFPALSSPWALFDNAGGSVPPGSVIDRITSYMRASPVQTGASYPLSQEATQKLAEGHRVAELLVGADPGEVVLGSSTTVLLRILADGMAQTLQAGDEVVVTNLDHEANIGSWLRLQRSGIQVRQWQLNPETARLELADLEQLLSPRTRLVCVTHCANVVGEIIDVRAIIELVHTHGARICVDGVAYAPHRQVDVKALDADFYAVSLYKVYGPHLGLLYGKRDALVEVAGQNHHFIGEDQVPYKFEPGGVSHELVAGLMGILDYFAWVEAHHFGLPSANWRKSLARVFSLFAAHEHKLMTPLLDFICDHSDVVHLVGPTTPANRVPTLAFTVDGFRPEEVAHALERHKVAIRHGDFYARRAVEALGLRSSGGVARVSMVHYNTSEEVSRLIEGLSLLLRG